MVFTTIITIFGRGQFKQKNHQMVFFYYVSNISLKFHHDYDMFEI